MCTISTDSIHQANDGPQQNLQRKRPLIWSRPCSDWLPMASGSTPGVWRFGMAESGQRQKRTNQVSDSRVLPEIIVSHLLQDSRLRGVSEHGPAFQSPAGSRVRRAHAHRFSSFCPGRGPGTRGSALLRGALSRALWCCGLRGPDSPSSTSGPIQLLRAAHGADPSGASCCLLRAGGL